MGHIARDCPEPERTCYVCNKSGHISRQCTENKSENRNAKVISSSFPVSLVECVNTLQEIEIQSSKTHVNSLNVLGWKV